MNNKTKAAIWSTAILGALIVASMMGYFMELMAAAFVIMLVWAVWSLLYNHFLEHYNYEEGRKERNNK